MREIIIVDTIGCVMELQPGSTMLKTESPQSSPGRGGR